MDIETVALPESTGKVQKLGSYDKRGIAPLKNPQKRWAVDVPEGAHGMVQKPGSCTGHIGSTSSGMTSGVCQHRLLHVLTPAAYALVAPMFLCTGSCHVPVSYTHLTLPTICSV